MNVARNLIRPFVAEEREGVRGAYLMCCSNECNIFVDCLCFIFISNAFTKQRMKRAKRKEVVLSSSDKIAAE